MAIRATAPVTTLSVGACMAAGLLMARPASADIWVYDGFHVAPGGYGDSSSIHSTGHGTGWSSDWTVSSTSDNYVTRSGSIAPDASASQDGVLIRAGGNQESSYVSRSYTQSFGGATPSVDEAWFSFAFQRNESQRELVINPFGNNASPGQGQFVGLYAANGSANMVGRMRYGTSAEIATSSSSVALTLGTEYFVVGKVEFNPEGTADVMSAYFLDPETFDGTLPAAPDLTVSTDFNSSFDTWGVSTQNPLNKVDVLVLDEFRLGSTLADVTAVPEPGATTLVLIAAIATAGRRQRR